jgi:predicted secreted protein
MPANYIDPILGDTVLIKVQSQSNAAIYDHPAIINKSRSVAFSTKTVDDELVDLNDQSAPAQTVRRVASFDIKIDGSGSMPKTSAAEYTAWAMGNAAVRNLKVSYANTTISGPFVLSSFTVTGERLESVQAQITLEQAGAVTYTSI